MYFQPFVWCLLVYTISIYSLLRLGISMLLLWPFESSRRHSIHSKKTKHFHDKLLFGGEQKYDTWEFSVFVYCSSVWKVISIVCICTVQKCAWIQTAHRWYQTSCFALASTEHIDKQQRMNVKNKQNAKFSTENHKMWWTIEIVFKECTPFPLLSSSYHLTNSKFNQLYSETNWLRTFWISIFCQIALQASHSKSEPKLRREWVFLHVKTIVKSFWWKLSFSYDTVLGVLVLYLLLETECQ